VIIVPKSIHVTENDTEIDTVVEHITINTGVDTVIEIDKMFGPLVANAIRVRLDYDSVCWIIERERITYTVKSIIKDDNGITFIDNDINVEWDEVARIDANIHAETPWGDENG